MIRILAVTQEMKIVEHASLESLSQSNIKWYWVDFDRPSAEEAVLLEQQFHFHPLAIEDCIHWLQRPKVDHYPDLHFFIMHAINPATLKAEEVDFFLGTNFIVTFHLQPSTEIDHVWQQMTEQRHLIKKGHVYATYLVMDNLVDSYFPTLYQIEDQLNELENQEQSVSIQKLLEQIYTIRADLLKIRKTVIPMRDLFYRIISSDKIAGIKQHTPYFTNIYDHLLKLSEMIESNREITADMRDSYNSLLSNRMNNIMKTLTVVTSIFIPLTFIVGIYGMNFDYMPELAWRWGYFSVLGVMAVAGFGMFFWLWRKGWFD
ncbi:magnesium/cobalt transporter CorA [Paenibacillus sp. 481]|uniref:magnesium/cobalt transporter CorA n=1 Tax=Paenibacillus sp. 481 TaxID=2835869 RepID=UPI001E61E8EE|nr:magnesium/cobalt transporter CorA [Paenibacillus sp. 481]UHA73206.1 magnesium/cobalt transporter CorA [Paenibacillus sp. 481]